MCNFVENTRNIQDICEKYSLNDPLTNLFSQNINIVNELNSLMKNDKKYKLKKTSLLKKSKYTIETGWAAFRRSVSFVDLFSDLYLLYLASTNKILPFSVALFLSILCPYIVSYSCGVKMFFINGNYGDHVGLKKIIGYLRLSPFGVLQFIFLDVLDVLFCYYKLIAVIFFSKSELEMKFLEENVANELGMSRMDYEGIKRQRCVSQIMFEALPQGVLQLLLLFGIYCIRKSWY